MEPRSLQNTLQKSKIEFLKKSTFKCGKGESLIFSFHGIPISFHTSVPSLISLLKEYLPDAWVKNKSLSHSYKIFHQSPAQEIAQKFDNESSSDVFHFKNSFKGCEQIFAVQRDFVATLNTQERCYYCHFEPIIDDGLHNFFRWMLSPLLLDLSKAMLHAAALINEKEEAFLFLGPSGAGKTTMTEMGSPRLVLSDDMNLVSFENDKLFVSAGGVGGLYKPQVALDRKFEVKNLFWLNQAKENSIVELSPLQQVQFMLSSFANLPWKNFSKDEQEKAFNSAQAIINCMPLKQLNFTKEASIWNLIDSP